MSATLLAVVIALVLGHMVQPLAGLRQFHWFTHWLHWLSQQAGLRSVWQGPWAATISIGVPVLVIALLTATLHQRFFGLPLFVFSLASLFYAWGPRDLDQDVDHLLHADDPDSTRELAAHLNPDGEVLIEPASMVSAVFAGALQRWFAVLLWFLLLGPMGAIGYRLLTLASRDGQLPERHREVIRRTRAILEWPAAHLMTLALALVANFDNVLAAWRDWQRDGWRLNIDFLFAAAHASVSCELAAEAADGDEPIGEAPALLALRDAMSLVWRILLVWLAVLAMFVLAGWAN
jgi:AmpE protein